MSELHVYDFGGTLFRSPHAPAVWDKDWWNRHVPESAPSKRLKATGRVPLSNHSSGVR